MILSVLPPVYKLPDMVAEIVGERSVDANAILWLLGYSAICFAAGLIVLRKRPFA